MADDNDILIDRFEIVDKHVTDLRRHFDAIIVIGVNIDGSENTMVWSDYGPGLVRTGMLHRALDQMAVEGRESFAHREELDNKDDDDG